MSEKLNSERKNVTVFGEETELNGTLDFSDHLIITGKFTGSINSSTGELELVKTSVLDVKTITAKSIEISGIVKGPMKASERIEIFSGSKVESDITTARLRIANNVDYHGNVTMLEREPDVDLFSVVSSEFRQSLVVHSDVVK